MQDNIIVREKDGSIQVFPDDIRSFCYDNVCYESLWWSDDSGSIVRKFCARILRGAIPVFICHDIKKDDEGRSRVSTILYFKEHNEYKRTMSFNFDLSKLEHARPDLSERVENGQINNDDILAIISECDSYLEPKTSH